MLQTMEELFVLLCKVCTTHLRKILPSNIYEEMSTYEDELEAITPLGF